MRKLKIETMWVIDGPKLAAARGARSRGEIASEIARRSGLKCARQSLLAWERGDYLPSEKLVPYLLAVLGVRYDEIAAPQLPIE